MLRAVEPGVQELQRLQDFKKHTEDKLRGIRCPRHHQAPRVKFHGSSLREISITMTGCCDQLIELANRAIAEGPKPGQA